MKKANGLWSRYMGGGWHLLGGPQDVNTLSHFVTLILQIVSNKQSLLHRRDPADTRGFAELTVRPGVLMSWQRIKLSTQN